MPQINKYPVFSHLRAGPNEHVLCYARGRVVQSGVGVSFWFRPLTASISMVPVQDLETTYILRERTADMQEVAVQCTITFRVTDAARAAMRYNFSISTKTGLWVEKPLERLENAWSLRARDPSRAYISQVSLTEAVTSGPLAIRERLLAALKGDAEIEQAGLTLVTLTVNSIAPAPEVQRALETPTREAIQQRADAAVFERRALAVEKERAIKENELLTQIELERKQEDLIKRQGANKLLEEQSGAEVEKARVLAESERGQLAAHAYAAHTRIRAEGDAQARTILASGEAKGDQERISVYQSASPDALRALVIREIGVSLPEINHLNVTPELLGESLSRFLRRQSDR